MLLVEAARQAARAACSRPDVDFALFEAEFMKLVEFSYPVDVVVTRLESHAAHGVMRVRLLHEEETLMSLLAQVKTPH
ncbi:hypothetical protein AHiyo8_61200 [Arthrobacter sp. Hiyo8]|nr:hypothetical protein AHiyo8_61200 [Arthrobacter sp. Hiyo8]